MHNHTSDTMTVTNDGAWLRHCWSVFARHFCAEAGEHGLDCRVFSLPQFIDFLVNGGTRPSPACCICNSQSRISDGAGALHEDLQT